MIHFFTRGSQTRSCELRLDGDGTGYELVVTEGSHERAERFHAMGRLLAREHELFAAWRALGWRQCLGRDTDR
jgi:hypothetical protein